MDVFRGYAPHALRATPNTKTEPLHVWAGVMSPRVHPNWLLFNVTRFNPFYALLEVRDNRPKWTSARAAQVAPRCERAHRCWSALWLRGW